MILKGELSRTVPLEDLKDNKKFGHSLRKCWAAFKGLFSAVDLTEFDAMIAELDQFGSIRYPDKILAQGVAIGIGFGRWHSTRAAKMSHPVPQYRLVLGDVDAFFARVIRLCRMNPLAYIHFLTQEGREMLMKDNDEAKDWLEKTMDWLR